MLIAGALLRQRGSHLSSSFRILSSLEAIQSHLYSSDAAVQDNQMPNSRTKRDNRIRYFIVNNRSADALDLLERSVSHTPLPDSQGKLRFLKLPPASVCNKVLDSACRTGNVNLVNKAADLADAIQMQGLTVEARTAQTLVGSLAATGQLDRALELVDRWLAAHADELEDESAESAQQLLTRLLEACARSDDADMVSQVLLRMARAGLSPPPASIISLMQLFCRIGQYDTSRALLGWMRRSDMEPTAAHYTACMSPLLPLEKAHLVYQDLKENNGEASPHFYANYLTVCGRGQDAKAARRVWQDLHDAEIEPDVVIYNALIDAFARVNNEKAVFHTYEDMLARNIKPDAISYATLLAALQRGPNGAARIVWEDMLKAGIKPDIITVGGYVEALLAEGEVALAIQVLKERGTGGQHDKKQGRKAEEAAAGTSVLWQRAVASSLQHNKRNNALAVVLDTMMQSGVPLGIHGAALLLNARARAAKLQNRWMLKIPADLKPHDLNLGPHGWDIVLNLRKTIEGRSGGVKSSVNEIAASAALALSKTEGLNADEAALLVAWLTIESRYDDAFGLYFKHSNEFALPVRAWLLNALLFGAINAAPDAPEQRAALALRVTQEARKWADSGSGWFFDAKMQRVAIKMLRQVVSM